MKWVTMATRGMAIRVRRKKMMTSLPTLRGMSDSIMETALLENMII